MSPVATQSINEQFEYGGLWDTVLPDGVEYCHWGGKELTDRLIGTLSNRARNNLIDVCCGSGGTLSSLSQGTIKVGVDNSFTSIRRAQDFEQNEAMLICADVCKMPVKDESFFGAIMQDGDAWFGGNLSDLTSEVFRILKPSGEFAIQTYHASEYIPDEVEIETEKRLNAFHCQYRGIPTQREIVETLGKSGFEYISAVECHNEYERDSHKMLALLKQNKIRMYWNYPLDDVRGLRDWLKWSSFLFRNRYWSGIIIHATKAEPSKLATKI